MAKKNLPAKTTEPKLYISTIDEFRPQEKNANKHNERGIGLLSRAMQEDGYVAPMTATSDGEVIDGSARLEAAAEKFGDKVLVVEHSGTMPIVMKRVDIPNAETDEAKRISIRANRVAEIDLNWDTEILKELPPVIIEDLWTEKEWAKLLGYGENSESQEPANGSKEVTCPQCGHVF